MEYTRRNHGGITLQSIRLIDGRAYLTWLKIPGIDAKERYDVEVFKDLICAIHSEEKPESEEVTHLAII